MSSEASGSGTSRSRKLSLFGFLRFSQGLLGEVPHA